MFDTIVVAVDGSECSLRAAGLAGDLAADSGGEVIVVHFAETRAAWSVAVETETPEEASDLADSVVRGLKDRGVSARSHVRRCFRGGVAGALVELAQAECADILVMGSRGLGDIAGLMLGSVTHRVLHDATFPVLIIR